MAIPDRLADDEIQERLATLPGWFLAEGRIRKDYEFASFVDAFAFMTRCADVAEELGHHPEWSNVYNRVTVELTTHDAGGITDLDFTFAARAEQFV
ncbi:MAG: 4a-hydroxytetrahydrobiopterin dehydratase [Acidimicrobiales bacterium]